MILQGIVRVTDQDRTESSYKDSFCLWKKVQRNTGLQTIQQQLDIYWTNRGEAEALVRVKPWINW